MRGIVATVVDEVLVLTGCFRFRLELSHDHTQGLYPSRRLTRQATVSLCAVSIRHCVVLRRFAQ